MKARVVAVCLGKEKGKPKEDVRSGFLEAGYGLVGDAHAGMEKQVSILLKEHVDRLSRETGIVFPPGAFAENLLIEGADEALLEPGKRLKAGQAILQVERIGKEPGIAHSYHYHGYSLLPRLGVFARVIQDGIVKNGDEVELITSTP